MEYFKVLLPVIVAAISSVIVILVIIKEHKKNGKIENYMNEGLTIGLCLGAGIGASFLTNITYFISIGMLVGFWLV